MQEFFSVSYLGLVDIDAGLTLGLHIFVHLDADQQQKTNPLCENSNVRFLGQQVDRQLAMPFVAVCR